MANEMRDRLVTKIEIASDNWWYKASRKRTVKHLSEYIADYLLDDGWIRPPCKVGQIVYIINDFDTEEPYVLPVEVVELGQSKNGQWVALDLPLGLKISRYISWDNIGKDVFFTEDHAEQKLKEMRGADNG